VKESDFDSDELENLRNHSLNCISDVTILLLNHFSGKSVTWWDKIYILIVRVVHFCSWGTRDNPCLDRLYGRDNEIKFLGFDFTKIASSVLFECGALCDSFLGKNLNNLGINGPTTTCLR